MKVTKEGMVELYQLFNEWYFGDKEAGIIGVKSEMDDWNDFLKKNLSKDPEDIDDAIQKCIGYMGRSVDIFAEAEKFYSLARGAATIDVARELPSLGSNQQKYVVDAKTATVKKAFTEADRLNAAFTHAIDGLRSRLSYQKEMHKKQPYTEAKV